MELSVPAKTIITKMRRLKKHDVYRVDGFIRGILAKSNPVREPIKTLKPLLRKKEERIA